MIFYSKPISWFDHFGLAEMKLFNRLLETSGDQNFVDEVGFIQLNKFVISDIDGQG